jgi:hypothetical protein
VIGYKERRECIEMLHVYQREKLCTYKSIRFIQVKYKYTSYVIELVSTKKYNDFYDKEELINEVWFRMDGYSIKLQVDEIKGEIPDEKFEMLVDDYLRQWIIRYNDTLEEVIKTMG